MRDGLRAWLKAIPGLMLIGQVSDGPAMLEVDLPPPPSLVLLGSNLPGDEIQVIVKQAEGKWPGVRCLVLVDSSEQQELAKAAGAEGILFTGFSTESFTAVIQDLVAAGPVSSR
jgi:DNA-binding NarL/FixJ family response regulator